MEGSDILVWDFFQAVTLYWGPHLPPNLSILPQLTTVIPSSSNEQEICPSVMIQNG